MEEIKTEEWIKVVKQAKRRSASPMFSKRNYSVYKCALENEKNDECISEILQCYSKKRVLLKTLDKVISCSVRERKMTHFRKVTNYTIDRGRLKTVNENVRRRKKKKVLQKKIKEYQNLIMNLERIIR